MGGHEGTEASKTARDPPKTPYHSLTNMGANVLPQRGLPRGSPEVSSHIPSSLMCSPKVVEKRSRNTWFHNLAKLQFNSLIGTQEGSFISLPSTALGVKFMRKHSALRGHVVMTLTSLGMALASLGMALAHLLFKLRENWRDLEGSDPVNGHGLQ